MSDRFFDVLLPRLTDILNPPQAAALECVQFGGFVFGFSRGEDDHGLLVSGFLLRQTLNCGTLVLLEPSGCQLLLREPHLNSRICCRFPHRSRLRGVKHLRSSSLVWCNITARTSHWALT